MPEKKLLEHALKLLTRRSYHSIELKNKLIRKKLAPTEEIEKVLEKLEHWKYLNDKIYIENYIQNQLRQKPQSVRLIKQKLSQKGLSYTNKEFEPYKINETKFAQRALEKKLKLLKNLPEQKQKEKLFRFLKTRGFSNVTIKQVLNDNNYIGKN